MIAPTVDLTSRRSGGPAATPFELPPGHEATAPPEVRGIPRDGVRLLVAEPGRVRHVRFHDLGRVLEPGDLVVVNTSGAVPAALDATREDGRPVVVHLAGPAPPAGRGLRTGGDEPDGGLWVVELRRPDAAGPELDGRHEEVVTTEAGARITLLRPASSPHRRLWIARIRWDGSDVAATTRRDPMLDHLARAGRPIAYGYVDGRYPIDAYTTVFGRDPGSAEMPSAGRPFTDAMVTDLVTRGIRVAPVVLHTGLSSPEPGEPPRSERYEVSAGTAELVAHTQHHGGRVVAVGTTVVRALETVARRDGTVTAGEGWTDLVLGPERAARVVDGLVTGWHEPGSSHLDLLEAVSGRTLVRTAYHAALEASYRWHEFGDSCLLLPGRAHARSVLR